ncbi:integrase [Pseudomonas sp. OG7]|uniref:DUF6538 domain-containing protein n=1 Tax=Pseudomonas sp. OG7 TaxID=2587037 RepID=UPI00161D0157|nr:DUF6538 domain-containing protein [Pseudomonas sp. OG7]MBB3273447.1 integrase [Pseudomonas sp. OG7]
MSYLSRRDGRYSYRRRFPSEVASLIGRSEYRKALGTADRTEASKLARVLSVEFDRICEEALASSASRETEGVPTPAPGQPTATDVLASLDSVVRTVTLDLVERMQRPGWQAHAETQQIALRAHVQGRMPPGVQMHPMVAKAALNAVERVLAGDPMPVRVERVPTPTPVADTTSQDGSHTAEAFEEVLTEYCTGVGPGRASKVRGLAVRVLAWPSTSDAQLERIMQHCAEKLAAGGRASSVHVDAAALVTVLKRLPGWSGLALPKTGSVAKAVRAGAGMSKDQRDPIPLEQMLEIHKAIKEQVPAHYPAAILLARYGLRPGELLQEGPAALCERVDILGKRELVFKAALSGGKNAASRRDLPVHPDDAPLFKAVLAGLDLAADCSRTVRNRRVRLRVHQLSRVFRRFLGDTPALTLYSQRHSCADLLRAVGATTEEVGGILGHAPAGSKATSIYGGSQPLDRPRELLAKVREFLPG